MRLFMITGIYRAKNVKLVLDMSKIDAGNLTVTIPVAELLGDPGILSEVLKLNATVNFEKSGAHYRPFETEELIYAVGYAEVPLRWYAPKNLHGRVLSRETSWKYMSTDAGEEDDFNEDREDIMELGDPVDESNEANVDFIYAEDFVFKDNLEV
ncbi:hypothetical protein BCR34DRAFT_607447 [Clohesyomyces aquaticus]|uniref:Uncharacterized protein n=1 Tax=Clohesyomyces aquaticus TaxID=1231657 RepID=A0A1Y1YGN7_9PLEO|nr:hypothetical protein BCR34DRAFT_607447 [Clohesyomyces aquaticus]